MKNETQGKETNRKVMGRPPSKEPKGRIVACRLTEREYNELNNYCSTNNTTCSNVLKQGMKIIVRGEVK